MDIKEEQLLGPGVAEHWYYVAKGKALLEILGNIQCKEILDVGAGSGIFSKILLDAGICKQSVCIDPAYRQELRTENYKNHDIKFVRSIAIISQQLILMIDVLEHVDNDLELLKSYTAHFQSNDRVLISVPAFNWLWSGHDVFLEHKRRYTLHEVEKLMTDAGLKVVRCNYFFGILFPVIALLRSINRLFISSGNFTPKSDLKKSPALLNKLLIFLHAIEQKTFFRINRVAGLSVLCLAEK